MAVERRLTDGPPPARQCIDALQQVLYQHVHSTVTASWLEFSFHERRAYADPAPSPSRNLIYSQIPVLVAHLRNAQNPGQPGEGNGAGEAGLGGTKAGFFSPVVAQNAGHYIIVENVGDLLGEGPRQRSKVGQHELMQRQLLGGGGTARVRVALQHISLPG